MVLLGSRVDVRSRVGDATSALGRSSGYFCPSLVLCVFARAISPPFTRAVGSILRKSSAYFYINTYSWYTYPCARFYVYVRIVLYLSFIYTYIKRKMPSEESEVARRSSWASDIPRREGRRAPNPMTGPLRKLRKRRVASSDKRTFACALNLYQWGCKFGGRGDQARTRHWTSTSLVIRAGVAGFLPRPMACQHTHMSAAQTLAGVSFRN